MTEFILGYVLSDCRCQEEQRLQILCGTNINLQVASLSTVGSTEASAMLRKAEKDSRADQSH